MPKQIVSGHFQDFGQINNLDPELDSIVQFDNFEGFPTIGFSLVVPDGGKVIFEGTFNNINWNRITFRGITTDGYFTETSTSESFVGSISGLRKVRVRVIQAGISPGQFIGRAQRTVSILEGIEHSNPPHKFGYPCVKKDIVISTIQTGTILWTPNINKRFVITDLIIGSRGNTEGILTIFDETNSSGNRLFNSFIAVKIDPTFSLNLNTPFVSSAIGNNLRITTSAAMELSILVFGYESE